MPRHSRPTYAFEPLTMTWAEVAATVFRRSESWMRDHLPEDFPTPDPVLGVFVTEAVRAWVRRRFGLAVSANDPQAAEDILLERAHG
jgi:hypothetical protein